MVLVLLGITVLEELTYLTQLTLQPEINVLSVTTVQKEVTVQQNVQREPIVIPQAVKKLLTVLTVLQAITALI